MRAAGSSLIKHAWVARANRRVAFKKWAELSKTHNLLIITLICPPSHTCHKESKPAGCNYHVSRGEGGRDFTVTAFKIGRRSWVGQLILISSDAPPKTITAWITRTSGSTQRHDVGGDPSLPWCCRWSSDRSRSSIRSSSSSSEEPRLFRTSLGQTRRGKGAGWKEKTQSTAVTQSLGHSPFQGAICRVMSNGRTCTACEVTQRLTCL